MLEIIINREYDRSIYTTEDITLTALESLLFHIRPIIFHDLNTNKQVYLNPAVLGEILYKEFEPTAEEIFDKTFF